MSSYQPQTRDELIKRVYWHLDNESKPNGTVGYHGQEPYKSDLFDLCKIALEKGWTDSGSPLLSADGLRDAVVARYEVLGDDRKLELLNDYGVMWREWIYAMKKMAS